MRYLNDRAFVPFSFQLARELKPEAFILFCIVFFTEHLSENACTLSDNSLMRFLGIKTPARLRKYKAELINLGAILRDARPHYRNRFTTAYKPEGVGIKAQFIFNQAYSAREKVVLLLKAYFSELSAREIARRYKIGHSQVSTILKKQLPLAGNIFTNEVKTSRRNLDTSRSGQCRDNVRRVSGQYKNHFEIQNPKTSFFCPKTPFFMSENRTTRYAENNKDQQLSNSYTQDRRQAFVLFDRLINIGMKDRDLNFIKKSIIIFPNEPAVKTIQAAFITLKADKAGAIRNKGQGRRLAYLIGILNRHTGRPRIPGAPDIKAYIEQARQRKTLQERRQACDKARQEREQAAGRVIDRNKAYWQGLEPHQQAAILPGLKPIVFPGKYAIDFKPQDILDISLSLENFKSYCRQILSA
jgi:hypothetical protein